MISITKSGNAIVIEFTDNDKYLFDGTIEIAPNELMVVLDESEMATFKRSTNGDTLFSQLINKIQIGGNSVTKDTILDEFASIGFSSGGSGEGGAVNSVNGQTGDVVLTASSVGAYSKTEVNTMLDEKQEVFQVNAPMSFTRDEATQDLHLSIDLANYASKQDIANKADSSTVEDLSGRVTSVEGNITNLTESVNELDYSKQATLIAGQNIQLSEPDESGKVTISATGEVSVDWSEITGKPTNFADWNATEGEQVIANKPDLTIYATKTELQNVSVEVEHKADKADVYTMQEVDNRLATKQNLLEAGNNITLTSSGDKVTISVTGVASKNEVDTISADVEQVMGETTTNSTDIQQLQTSKQDTLVSGTTIKTVNGESILGAGNIVISGGTIDDHLDSESTNPVQNKVITAALPTAQTSTIGTNKNYIYGNENDTDHRVLRSVYFSFTSDNATLNQGIWGGNVSYPAPGSLMATPTKSGFMNGADKAKLDTVPTMQFLTQAEYDAITNKDENTLYLIKEG